MKKKFLLLLLGIMFIFPNNYETVNAIESDETIDLEDTEDIDDSSPEITEYETLTKDEIEDSVLAIPVTYSNESSYSITIPKNIVLDKAGTANYNIKINGNISPAWCIKVEVIDKIDNIEGTNFYMVDSGAKLLVNVVHPKTTWNYEDVKNGIESTDSLLINEIYPGDWEGEICFKISTQQVNPNHKHTYTKKILIQPTCETEGLELFTCECGDNYTENLDTIEHIYKNGICIMCGEEESNSEEDDAVDNEEISDTEESE